MWVILSVFLLVVVSMYLVFLILDLRKIICQFDYIHDEDTNAELVSTSKNQLIRQLLDSNNQLIRKNKRYYREQRQKEKQLHQLLSNLTHDLKTPLTVSSGYTQILLKDPGLNEQKEMLHKIDNSLQSISHYLGYLMEYNLIQEKGLALNLEQLNLSELLRENLFTYYEEFQLSALSLTIDIQEEVWLITDQTVLQRIFQNILGNMLKHGTSFAEITLHKTEEAIVFEFKNGLLEAIEEPALLFQRFLTEDPSRTNKSTGLGLHIVKELVALIDGEVQIDTEKEFEVVIQLKNQSEA
ncbi:sensor histidine kinase [Enterococcus sp. LJL128]|uniref:sensor histidine kinase n=1 Tax=Enterococcus sp. LJL51 TaxID=3416656 RepID=UPI003CF381FF